ncbi:flagellar hook-length control protein FliK [Skermanella mucosa]|uniref:flagellar hook-length control protein FliK n=1 Tax=Skermanella mucosa TaxID=1789672 RepID=UPI00192CA4F7|nr:flagellar hook-length control protein FliK [Skermanella mucosa]UEM20214.1 flagellar hook-length control protein FliK [Skermanella mucosa]
MEITQTITMPQAASTGSAGAAAAAPTAGGTADGGFLALVANLMTPQPFAQQASAEPATMEDADAAEQDAGALPDGLLSLIAPGLFSNLMVPQQQPVETGPAAGGLSADAGAPVPPADASDADPLPPALPGMFPMPPAQRPELPVKGMAPQAGQDADEDAAAADADAQDGDAPLDEEVLAKLVDEGKARLQAAARPAAQSKAQGEAAQPKPEQEAGIAARRDPEDPVVVQVSRDPAARESAAQQPAKAERQPETVAPTIRETAVQQPQPERQPVAASPAAPVANRLETAEAPAEGATTDGAALAAATASEDPAGGDPMSEEADQEDSHGSRQAARQADRHERAALRQAGDAADAETSRPDDAGTEDTASARPAGGPAAAPAEGGPAVRERGAKEAVSFEDALATAGNGNAVPVEPEADPAPAVQASAPGPADTEAADRTTPGHPRSPMPHTPAEQVSVQIGKAAAGRIDQMVINLKPVDLGDVEVKLDFGADGRVQASIRAERPETLEMLQKDQRTLERALADAGLRTDAGSLSFDLKGQGGNQRQFAGYTQPADRRGRNFGGIEEDLSLAAATATQYKPGGASRSRLDIRI